MRKQRAQSVTSLPESPDEERRSRMLKYSITMGVRMICVILAFSIPFWWRWIFVVGALVLPYIAVVIANTVRLDKVQPVVRPGAVVPVAHHDEDRT